MINLNIKTLSKLLNIEPRNADYSVSVKNVKIDSRLNCFNSLFIAIKGNNFDSHDFLLQAKKSGATAFIVSTTDFSEKLTNVFVVKDTVKAMQRLAKAYLKILNTKTIAITGSAGKTTTKDMLAFVLNSKFKIKATKGNLNNHIGVPMTIFEANNNTDYCILEIGINAFREMRQLSEIANPYIGIILNIGKAHLEKLKNLKGVLRAKWEMVENIEKDGQLFLNGDDELLLKKKADFANTKTYGKNLDNDISGKILSIKNDKQQIKIDRENLDVNILGEAGFYAAMATYSVCLYLGLDKKFILQKITDFNDVINMRQELKKINGINIFNDAYNANPTSMQVSLSLFNSLPIAKHAKKIIVLADMLELGENSEKEHRNLAHFLKDKIFDIIICYGKASFFIYSELQKLNLSKPLFWSDDKNKISNHLKDILRKDDFLFLKGSREMKMEDILKDIFKAKTK